MVKFPVIKSGRQNYLDNDLDYQHPIYSSVRLKWNTVVALTTSYSLWWICPTGTGRCCVMLERLPAQCDRAPPSSPSHARKSCHPRSEQRQTEEAKSGQTSCAEHFNHSNIVEKRITALWKCTFISVKCLLFLTLQHEIFFSLIFWVFEWLLQQDSL